MQPASASIKDNPDVFSFVNTQGEILCASPSTADVFGLRPEEIVGCNTLDLIHPDDRCHSRRALLSVLARPQSPCQVEVRVRRTDGAWCWVESTISNLLGEPRVSAIVVHFRDIGARKETREQEQRQIAELARCNQQLEECAYAVAHDFREPLRTISMFSELLLQNASLDEDGKLLAQYVVNGAVRMGAVFDGLHALAVSRVDEPAQSFDLNVTVAGALQDLQHAITTSGAIVTVDALPTVLGNERHLLRVFQNLIANAIKYRSEEQANILVTADWIRSVWIIKVKDNGVGIPSEDHERVFLLLKRLHGPEIPGAGIGLAICKQIIEGMGGSIWVESKPGCGSTFCFTIAAGSETTADPMIPRQDGSSNQALSKSGERLREFPPPFAIKQGANGR